MTSNRPNTVLMLVSTCCHWALVRPFVHVAEALRSANANVVILLTDGDCCSFFSKLKPPTPERCFEQRSLALTVFEDAGFQVIPLGALLPDAAAGADVLLQVSGQASGTVPVAPYKAHPSWNIVRATVTRHCDWDRLPDDSGMIRAEEAAFIEGFLRSTDRYQRIFEALFEEYAPSHLMVFNGVFYEEQIACDIAATHGIQVVLHESCCFMDRWIYRNLDPEIGIRESQRLRVPEDRRSITAEERLRLEKYLKGVYSGHNNRVYQPGPGAMSDTLQKLSACAKRIALFLGQVPYDTVITEDEMVTSVEDVILEVIKAFEDQEDWHLVIRLHPGARQTATHEDKLAGVLAGHPLAGTFTLVKAYEVSTYDLMQLAQVGITISSQAGLEVLGQHKPVILLGDAFYRDNDVTIDRETEEPIRSAVQRGLHFIPTDDWRNRVDAVLSYWIFHYLIEIDPEDGYFPPSSVERILQLFNCAR